jgi:hypothetical protein
MQKARKNEHWLKKFHGITKKGSKFVTDPNDIDPVYVEQYTEFVTYGGRMPVELEKKGLFIPGRKDAVIKTYSKNHNFKLSQQQLTQRLSVVEKKATLAVWNVFTVDILKSIEAYGFDPDFEKQFCSESTLNPMLKRLFTMKRYVTAQILESLVYLRRPILLLFFQSVAD